MGLAACLDFSGEDDGGAPVATEAPTWATEGQPDQDPVRNFLHLGIETWRSPKTYGPLPEATAGPDDPVITEVPDNIWLGPDARSIRVPVRLTDVTRLDPNEAPNRLLAGLVGRDDFHWEIPIDPVAYVAQPPEGYIWVLSVTGDQLDTLYALGEQRLRLAIGEANGAVGAYVEIPFTVRPDAFPPFETKDQPCPEVVAFLTTWGTLHGDEGTYTCSNPEGPGGMICRSSQALDARCAEGTEGVTVVYEGAAPLASSLDGRQCYPLPGLRNGLEEATRFGQPYDPETLFGTGTVLLLDDSGSLPCWALSTVPGVDPESPDALDQGYLCCR